MPRLAVCKVCHKIERLVDPPADTPMVPATVEWDDHGTIRKHTFYHDDGSVIMVPMYDPVLEDVSFRHTHGLSDVDSMQSLQLFPVEQETWEKMDVVTELKKELHNATGDFYEEAHYYRDEAVKCYNAHGNPEGGCIDYCDDDKCIGSNQIPKRHRTYLCYMCPVQQSYINVELRRRKGWYDPKKASALNAKKMRALGHGKPKKRKR